MVHLLNAPENGPFIKCSAKMVHLSNDPPPENGPFTSRKMDHLPPENGPFTSGKWTIYLRKNGLGEMVRSGEMVHLFNALGKIVNLFNVLG